MPASPRRAPGGSVPGADSQPHPGPGGGCV